MFGKGFFTPITAINTLLSFRCYGSRFRLRCSFALALGVYLILILTRTNNNHLPSTFSSRLLLSVLTFAIDSPMGGVRFASTGSVLLISSSITRGESSRSSRLSTFELGLSSLCSQGDEVFLLDVSLSLVVDIAANASFLERSKGCSIVACPMGTRAGILDSLRSLAREF